MSLPPSGRGAGTSGRGRCYGGRTRGAIELGCVRGPAGRRRVRGMQPRRRPDGPGGSLPGAGQVTSLELFFDLVFVFTITQLTATVQPGGWAVTGRSALLLLILWWMYGGDAWLTKSAPPATWRPRGLPGLGGDGNLLPA